jgi:hypothetical protein
MSPRAVLVLRRSVTSVLLGFVAVSVVTLVVQEVRGDRGGTDLFGTRPDGVLAVYFHRTKRCVSCRTMEALARAVVEKDFAGATAEGRPAWRVVDLDAPGNGHFADDFNLAASSVVLVEVKSGKPGRWKGLDKAWDLLEDEAALADFFRREVGAFLKGP